MKTITNPRIRRALGLLLVVGTVVLAQQGTIIIKDRATNRLATVDANNSLKTVLYDSSGNAFTSTSDPCDGSAKSIYRVDIVTATDVEIANAVADEFWYICHVELVTAGINNVLIYEDDTDGCGSATAGISSGGTTAGEGYNFAANSGIATGNGAGTIMKSTTANRYLCIVTSAAVQLSGVISYVSDP